MGPWMSRNLLLGLARAGEDAKSQILRGRVSRWERQGLIEAEVGALQ
jgi:hypothetical protein